jgi:cardiolipin synthase A/B
MRMAAAAIVLLLLIPCAHASTVETFVSPDSSFAVLSAYISGANESIALSTYTFTSPEIAQLLISRAAGGVSVSVIAEKSPAGGMPDDEMPILCMMEEAGVSVMLYDGDAPFMHAKYVVRDEKAVLVASENVGPEGFHPDGSYGNRGWGAVVYDRTVASEFASAFSSDFSVSVPVVCDGVGAPASGKEMGAYTSRFNTAIYENQDVQAVFSPDSIGEILALIASANESIDIEQLYVYTHWGSPSKDTVESAPSPLLEALFSKARQGVTVRLLLDSTYFNVEETGSTSNYHTAKLVSCIAENESIPIEAGLMELDGNGLKLLHDKGVIVDGKKVLVSSINWNNL